jgi:hypothetical protein
VTANVRANERAEWGHLKAAAADFVELEGNEAAGYASTLELRLDDGVGEDHAAWAKPVLGKAGHDLTEAGFEAAGGRVIGYVQVVRQVGGAGHQLILEAKNEGRAQLPGPRT